MRGMPSITRGAIAILLAGCASPSGPAPTADCPGMEIHYRRAGGWSETAVLDVYDEGHVDGLRLSHASLDTLSTIRTRLGPAAWQRLAGRFADFADYGEHYEPAQPIADGDSHRVVLVCGGQARQVTVYDPDRADLPAGLRRILRALEALRRDTMFPLD